MKVKGLALTFADLLTLVRKAGYRIDGEEIPPDALIASVHLAVGYRAVCLTIQSEEFRETRDNHEVCYQLSEPKAIDAPYSKVAEWLKLQLDKMEEETNDSAGEAGRSSTSISGTPDGAPGVRVRGHTARGSSSSQDNDGDTINTSPTAASSS